MDIPLPPPIVPVRDVLPTLGFTLVWGTATDLEPAYEFKGGGIDICVAQVTSLYLRPEFMIGGTAFNARVLRRVEQFMPLALESRNQVVAWLAFAVGADFRLLASVPWFEEGRGLQHLLPWEQRRAQLRAEMQENARLRLLRPHCIAEREALRSWLNAACRAVGWPPVPGCFAISFDGEILKLRVRSRLVAVQADGSAWPHVYAGELRHLHALPRRLDSDPVEIGIWCHMLEIGRVQVPVVVLDPAPAS